MTRTPADVFPPGDFLKEELDERGMTVADLAAQTDFSEATLQAVIDGHRGIGPALADALAEAFGTSVELWINLEETYRRWATSHPR